MGERSNIRFKQEHSKRDSGSIWLYSHWAGADIAGYLQAALPLCRELWTDEAYGTRFIIQHIAQNHCSEGGQPKLTGYGLSVYPTDNGYPFLEVNFTAQTVQLKSHAGFHDDGFDPDKATPLQTWTFQEFCDFKTDDWYRVYRPEAQTEPA